MAKILLVENEVQIQELVRDNLKRDGYNVIVAFNGEQGLELARRDKPDIIIIDLTLPLIDGFAVIKTLRT